MDVMLLTTNNVNGGEAAGASAAFRNLHDSAWHRIDRAATPEQRRDNLATNLRKARRLLEKQSLLQQNLINECEFH